MEYITDIADAFLNKKRIRTQSYRGSLLVTTCNVKDAIISSSNKIIIAPISYTSSIKSVGLAAKTDITCSPKLELMGIDKQSIDIKSSFNITTSDKAFTPSYFQEILPPIWSTLTLYELADKDKLCDKYKNDKYWFLAATISGIDSGNVNELYFQIQYVDGAPSDSPLMTKTISVESKKDG